MKKLVVTILCITLYGIIHFSFTINNKVIDEFSWLNGSWMMETKKGVIVESWKTNNDSTMSGKSSFTKHDEAPRLSETIELVYRKGSYYYIPTASGQNNNKAVTFKISFFDGSGFVAENPDHDFPKRITYQLINKDSIHAFIDGGPKMPEKKSDFYFSRVKE